MISNECILNNIDLNSKLSPNTFAKIGSICAEFTRIDQAFSLNNLNKFSNNKQENLLHFPMLTKCAIIAVYCASYNPPHSDQIFFYKV